MVSDAENADEVVVAQLPVGEGVWAMRLFEQAFPGVGEDPVVARRAWGGEEAACFFLDRGLRWWLKAILECEVVVGRRVGLQRVLDLAAGAAAVVPGDRGMPLGRLLRMRSAFRAESDARGTPMVAWEAYLRVVRMFALAEHLGKGRDREVAVSVAREAIPLAEEARRAGHRLMDRLRGEPAGALVNEDGGGVVGGGGWSER